MLRAPSSWRSPVLARYLPGKPGPLLALSVLIFVHQFEVIGFAVLTPELRDAFDVSDTTIGAIGNATSVAALLLAYPIGVLADRYSRVASVRIGAVVFVVAALATSFAWALPVLVVARLLAGLPPMAADVVQPGLLGDLYDDKDQPRVFAVWRGAATVSGVSALFLGGVASLWGWRAAFLVTALLGVAVLLPSWRVRDPDAGASKPSLEASLDVEAELLDEARPGSPTEGLDDADGGRAVGLLRRRWLWVAAFFFGASTIPLNTVLSLFFEDVYGTGPFGRGVLIAVATVGTLIGLAVGAPLAERDDQRHGTPGLITAMTRSLVLFAAAIVLIGIAPVLLLSGAGVVLGSIAGGMLLVAFYPLINRSSPAGRRSRTFATITFVAGLGAIGSIPLFTVGDSAGYRAAMLGVAALAAVMALASWMLGRDQVGPSAVHPPVRL
jgi:MFS family permease